MVTKLTHSANTPLDAPPHSRDPRAPWDGVKPDLDREQHHHRSGGQLRRWTRARRNLHVTSETRSIPRRSLCVARFIGDPAVETALRAFAAAIPWARDPDGPGGACRR